MDNNNKKIDILNSASIDETLKLDNQLCFALYVSSKEIIKKYKPLLDPLGLTYTSYITLLALWEEDNVNVKDLGKKLFLDSGTLTPILKKLEAANLVHRIRSKTDERNVFISLTNEGRLLKEKASCVPTDLVCSMSKSEINNIKAAELLSMLHQLMTTLTSE